MVSFHPAVTGECLVSNTTQSPTKGSLSVSYTAAVFVTVSVTVTVTHTHSVTVTLLLLPLFAGADAGADPPSPYTKQDTPKPELGSVKVPKTKFFRLSTRFWGFEYLV